MKIPFLKYSKNKTIIEQANKICNHVFDLLGSGEINLGKNIQWNQDFKSGYIWENKYYKDIKRIDLDNNADVKVPIELSRFQHIPCLGQAYHLTKDTKYIIEFRNQIESWIESNPVDNSVNWSCQMDNGIRAVNWILGYYYFKNSIGQEFWDKYNKVLFSHGESIFRDLKPVKYNGNHYISEIVSLIWLGLYLNNKTWLEYSLQEVEKEMRSQVTPDGVNYESSTFYHCLVTELLFYTTILCLENDISLSKEYLDRVQNMLKFIKDITKPNGLIPLMGDMDDGRFIIFENYYNREKGDYRFLIEEGFDYFNVKHNLKTRAYKGYYIFRKDNLYMIIKCGGNGLNNNGSGHTHNDQLSFELNIDGRDFIIDPGCCCYTSDYKMRNLFRSTKMHNVLQVGNLEQNDFNNIFSIKNETNAELLVFREDYFKGIHYGYENKAGVITEREIKLENNKIKIIDKIKGKTNLQKTVRLYLDKNVEISEGKYIKLKNREINIKLYSDDEYQINNAYVSKGFGVKEKTKMICFDMKNQESNIIIERD